MPNKVDAGFQSDEPLVVLLPAYYSNIFIQHLLTSTLVVCDQCRVGTSLGGHRLRKYINKRKQQ